MSGATLLKKKCCCGCPSCTGVQPSAIVTGASECPAGENATGTYAWSSFTKTANNCVWLWTFGGWWLYVFYAYNDPNYPHGTWIITDYWGGTAHGYVLEDAELVCDTESGELQGAILLAGVGDCEELTVTATFG